MSSVVNRAVRPTVKPSLSNPSHSHSHSHSNLSSIEDSNSVHDEAGLLLNAISGSFKGDKGSQITLIGLIANVALTGVKAIAGWALNSASLLADAGHSFSDLLGDFVVLFCWKLSRRPPTSKYPFGYGKWESVGSLAVSVLLLAGGLGIGLHSFAALRVHLSPNSMVEQATTGSSHSHSHSLFMDEDHSKVDPNAAWFALASILIKEYLYRITAKIARAEKSNVLMANAMHHRSDAFSGLIALAAIATAWMGLSLADAAGGALVALMIIKQGASMFDTSFAELVDSNPDISIPGYIKDLLLAEEAQSIEEGIQVRTFKSGGYTMVNVKLKLRDTKQNVETLLSLQHRVKTLIEDFLEGGVSEVVVQYLAH